jgi:hypothetical protein
LQANRSRIADSADDWLESGKKSVSRQHSWRVSSGVRLRLNTGFIATIDPWELQQAAANGEHSKMEWKAETSFAVREGVGRGNGVAVFILILCRAKIRKETRSLVIDTLVFPKAKSSSLLGRNRFLFSSPTIGGPN